MYTIIGGDGKEYGPVTADQVRVWISSGRANLETRAKAVGSDEWRTLGEFADFAPGGAGEPPIFSSAGAAAAAADPAAARTGAMALEVSACYERGWALLKANFWPFVGIFLFVIVLPWCLSAAVKPMIGLPVFGSSHVEAESAAALFASPEFALMIKGVALAVAEGLFFSFPLGIGFYYYILRRSRGEPATFSDIFSGFKRAYLSLLVSAILMLVLVGLGCCFFLIPGIYLAVSYSLTPIIIVDRQVGPWTAMEMSRRAITSHWWTMLGITLIGILLVFAGIMALLVGVLVAVPLCYCAKLYAYLDLFPAPAPSAANTTQS